MKFVFSKVMVSVAICLTAATTATAQLPTGYGVAPGAMRQAPYGTITPSSVQSNWSKMTAPITNALTNKQAAYPAPTAYNPAYGMPAMRSFTPTPSQPMQAMPAGTMPVGSMPVGAMAPTAPMAAPVAAMMPSAGPAVAQTGCDGGCGGGCAECGISGVTAQPIYGPESYMTSSFGPYVNGGPVFPVEAAMGAGAGCPNWFGGVYGLIMDRDGEDDYFVLQNRADPRNTFFNANDADMDFAGGVEARLGKTFCCCRWGLEGVYWGLFPDDQSASFSVPQPVANPYDLRFDTNNVFLNLSDPITGPYRDSIYNQFQNGANAIRAVRLDRSFEYHNVEINILSGPLTPSGGGGCGGGCGGSCGGGCGSYGMSGPTSACGDGCGGYYGGNCYGACHTACGPRPRLNVGWLFGVRFFKIDEAIRLSVDAEDGVYNSGDPSFEFRHNIQTENNLVGVQMGVHLDYYLTKCLHLEAGSKFGFYGNHVNSSQRISNDLGDAYVTAAGVETDYDFHSSKDDIAYLGELRLGLGYKLSCNFRLTGGYRVVAASGVALPLDQIQHGQQFAAPSAFDNINTNGNLVLHGGYAGLEFAW
jgi:hypothetical protein